MHANFNNGLNINLCLIVMDARLKLQKYLLGIIKSFKDSSNTNNFYSIQDTLASYFNIFFSSFLNFFGAFWYFFATGSSTSSALDFLLTRFRGLFFAFWRSALASTKKHIFYTIRIDVGQRSPLQSLPALYFFRSHLSRPIRNFLAFILVCPQTNYFS